VNCVRLIHTYRAVSIPRPRRAAKGLDSYPFDLFSVAVLDSHMICRTRAMPRPCLSEKTSQGHGTARHGSRHGRGM
jgi:hypothetical protein